MAAYLGPLTTLSTATAWCTPVYFGDDGVRYRNRWVRSRGLEAERRRGHACYSGLAEFRPVQADVAAEAGGIKNVANSAVPPYLRCHVADAHGDLVRSVDLDLPAPVMMHDFVVTERYALFLDAPAVFDVGALVAGGPPLRWEPERGARIGVLPRRGAPTDVRWFDIDPCYVVHFFNAFEDGNTIRVFGPRMPTMPGGFEFQNPTAAPNPYLWSWSVDLEAGRAADEQLSDVAGEFSRIDDRRVGRRHRYGYCALQRDSGFEFSFQAVVKHDRETGSARTYTYGEASTCGEHVFAPDPAGRAEDDGWLLSFVTDAATSGTDLVVLDARDVEAGPVARVRMPRRVPLGFHANWLPED